MRLPSPKFAVLAIAVCIGLVQQVEADAQAKQGKKVNDQKNHHPQAINHHQQQQQQQQQEEEQEQQYAVKGTGFEVQNHGHHHHGKHPHHCEQNHQPHDNKNNQHHKQHDKHQKPDEKEECTQIDLVCDHFVIDSILCRVPKAVTEDGSVFEKTNGCSKDQCKGEPKVEYINMEQPCYNLPTECSSLPSSDAGAFGSDVDSDAGNVDDVDEDDDNDNGNDEDDEDYDTVESEDFDSIDSENVLVKRHQKQKKKSHQGEKSKGDKKQKHPWAGLCVGSGSFCGSSLFGCDFIPSAVYTCSQHAGKPTFVKVCLDGCNKGACNGEGSVAAFTTTTTTVAAATAAITTTTTTTSKVVLPVTTKGQKTTDKPKITTDSAPTTTQGGVASPPVESTTVSTSKPDPTERDVCICGMDGKACGSTFPSECNFVKDSVYSCALGMRPGASQACSNGCSAGACNAPPVDPCACKEVGDVCGSTFDKSCSKDKSTLYMCRTAGEQPIKNADCADGCMVNAGVADECIKPVVKDPCDCVDDKPFCSGANPPCRRTPNAAYECAGKGKRPVLKALCGANDECKAEDGKASCVSKPNDNSCGCRYFKEICGFDLPEDCASVLGGEITLDGIYHCPKGDRSLAEVKSRCGAKSICRYSSSDANSAVCDSIDDIPKYCLCTRNGDVCGYDFDYRCGWEETVLYQCKKGEVPLRKSQCLPSGCQAVAGSDNDVCSPVPEKCLCFENSTLTQRCGSSFDPECYYEQNTIYDCTNGPVPKKLQTCAYGCKRNVISMHSECVSNGEVAPDCKCPDEGIYCGNALDKGCKADPAYMYSCQNGKGSKPVVGTMCVAGTVCVYRPDTKDSQCLGVTPFSPCTCPGKGKFCTEDLDPSLCSSLIRQNGPNAIYDCTNSDEPELASTCPSGSVCLTEDRQASCGTPHCNCTAGGKSFCSSDFSRACKLIKNSVYECSKDGAPKFSTSCASDQECLTLDDGAICASKDCLCPTDGTICSKLFPHVCGFDDKTLLSCVAGEKPSQDSAEMTSCPGGCTSSIDNLTPEEGMEAEDADDICLGDCTCKEFGVDVCGSKWNEACGYDNNKLYRCDRQSAKPTEKETCNNGCTAGVGSDACSAGVNCRCTAKGGFCASNWDESCSLDSNTIYTCDGPDGTPNFGKKCAKGCDDDSEPNVCVETAVQISTSLGPAPTSPAASPTASSLAVISPAVTSSSAPAPTFPPLTCDAVVQQAKDAVTVAFNQIDTIVALVPEPVKSLIAPYIPTVEGYKDKILGGFNDTGTFVAILASASKQLGGLLTKFSDQFVALGIPQAALSLSELALGALSTVAQKAAECLKAPKNCSGLLTVMGYAIKLVLPSLKDQLTNIPSFVVNAIVDQATKTADDLIAGTSAGVASARTLIGVINSFSFFLPDKIKLPLQIMQYVLDESAAC